MSQPSKTNSWSKSDAPQEGLENRRQANRSPDSEWALSLLSGAEGEAWFARAHANPFLRLLTVFAVRKTPILAVGLLLIAAAAYCLTAPAGSTFGGLPAEMCSIAAAAAAVVLAMLVTLGAWLRQLQSVEDAVEVLSVPLIAFEKRGTSDVH